MKLFLKKKARIIAGIVIGILVVFSGTMFALAKVGVVKIGILADETNNSTMEIYVQKDDGTPYGAGVPITASIRGRVDATTMTQAGTAATALGNEGSLATLRNLFPNQSYTISFELEACHQSTNLQSAANGGTAQYVYKLTCSGTSNPQEKKYNLTGYVRNAQTGAIISGATINKIGGYSATTDASGRFLLSNITYTSLADLGSHQYQVSAQGYNPSELLNLAKLGVDPTYINDGSTVGGSSIALQPISAVPPTGGGTVTPPAADDTFTLTGKVVVGTSTKPVPGAVVKLGTSSGTLQQTTGADGSFTFTNYPIIHPDRNPAKQSTGALYTIKAEAMGYSGTYVATLNKHGITNVNKGSKLTISPNVPMILSTNIFYIYGMAADQNGNPVAGATIKSEFGSYAMPTVTSAATYSESGAFPGKYNYMLTVNIGNYNTQDGKLVILRLTPPAGYDNNGLGVSYVTIRKDTPFIEQDLSFKKTVLMTRLSGSITDSATNEKIDGVNVKVYGADDNALIAEARSVNGRYDTGLTVPRKSIKLRISGQPSGYTVVGGAEQTVNLASAGDSFTKDIKLAPAPTVVSPTSTLLYGTVKDEAGNLVQGLTLNFSVGAETLSGTVSQAANLTDSISEQHNYVVSLPKKIVTYCPQAPRGYTLTNFTCNSVDLTRSGDKQRQDFVLKSEAGSSINILGNLVVKGSSSALVGVKVKAYSLNSRNKSVSVAETVSQAFHIERGYKHNYDISNLPTSDINCYIIASDKYDVQGTLFKPKGGQKGVVQVSGGFESVTGNYVKARNLESQYIDVANWLIYRFSLPAPNYNQLRTQCPTPPPL